MGAVSWAQVKRQFNVEGAPECETIKLSVKANSGNCYIKPSQSTDLLNVFSNQDSESYSHNFSKEVVNRTCIVKLNLEESRSGGMSHNISNRVFGSGESGNRYWKMYLTDTRPYFLDLSYGVGNANVDLSGLAIRNLKINTGSADVLVGYSAMENQVEMDTFSVKVDLGSIKVRSLNMARTHFVKADVAFGNMELDFSGAPMASNRVVGSVGAGNLIIVLPDAEVPVLVKIHDSWLCSVKMVGSLKKIGENTYATASYTANSENAMLFDLDVSMGNIVFKEVVE